MDDLRKEIRDYQERWNSMVRDITADLKITCEEAQKVRQWVIDERKRYIVLKKKLNLDLRTLRSDYGLKIKQAARDDARKLRLERDEKIYPYKTLKLSVEELLIKADEMKLRVDRLIDQCEERGEVS
jgi:hypothetical protein